MADNETQLGGVRVDGEGHTIRADHIDASIHAEGDVVGRDKITTNITHLHKYVQTIADDLEEDDLRPGALQSQRPALSAGNSAAYLDELERQGLEREAETLARKLNYFRDELAKAYDAGQKFALREQIAETERQLKEIREKLQG